MSRAQYYLVMAGIACWFAIFWWLPTQVAGIVLTVVSGVVVIYCLRAAWKEHRKP